MPVSVMVVLYHVIFNLEIDAKKILSFLGFYESIASIFRFCGRREQKASKDAHRYCTESRFSRAILIPATMILCS